MAPDIELRSSKEPEVTEMMEEIQPGCLTLFSEIAKVKASSLGLVWEPGDPVGIHLSHTRSPVLAPAEAQLLLEEA